MLEQLTLPESWVMALNAFLDQANGLLWSGLAFLLVGVGLYFTVATRAMQLRFFGHMFKVMGASRQGANGGISSFQAFSTSLAARVGTGNLAGVAVAITAGGPGAVFWMWVTAMVGMSTAFIESTLAQVFKVSHHDQTSRGGPAYYIERGLGQRWLGIVFALCLIVAFGFAFNSVQSNSIARAMEGAFGWSPGWIGLLLVALSAPVFFGGMKRIARLAEMIVPVMALLYLALAVIIVLSNLDQLGHVMGLIFGDAFAFDKVAAGGVGWLTSQALVNGVQRGLFSNEAGMGSAPNAAATATTAHPAAQGLVQMMGVFVDTLVICTCTAAIILMAGTPEASEGISGIQLTQDALIFHVGDWGGDFIAVAIFLFCYTSLIANYSYGESNLEYIAGQRNARPVIFLYRLLVLGMIMIGAIAQLKTIWSFANLSMGSMALINLIAIMLLSPIAIRVLKDYETQRLTQDLPRFKSADHPQLAPKLDHEVWPEGEER
ncbi:alanine/glycine:cation symporter family protein [Terasakiispira papahanaumokuakeensis]|nr:alanine/glycine:cation symporter family protein [Terasakiispira papahanaumokuakeensis]